MRLLLIATLLTSFYPFHLKGQLIDDVKEDESKFYAQSKQLSQFFRRFNGEEDVRGERLYPKDKQYHNTKLRKKYLATLFDENNQGIDATLKSEFTRFVLDNETTSILNFHGGNWFSEVRATFQMNGKTQPVTLFMILEKDHLGSKWVIQKVDADMFDPPFARDTTRIGQFLHPLSHELDFMNLRKAFDHKDSVAQFTIRNFTPDHLTLFLYEINKGNLKFKSVDEVTFHFFQLNGWYFEVAQFNRPGYNTGWLISNLAKLNSETEKELLRRYLYHETN